MLMVRPNLREAEAKQFAKRWIASRVQAARAQSSANKRSYMVENVTLVAASKCLVLVVQRPRSHLDLMPTPSVEVLKATCNIAEKNIENKVGASTHPCLVPLVTSNVGDLSLPSLTDAFMLI